MFYFLWFPQFVLFLWICYPRNRDDRDPMTTMMMMMMMMMYR